MCFRSKQSGASAGPNPVRHAASSGVFLCDLAGALHLHCLCSVSRVSPPVIPSDKICTVCHIMGAQTLTRRIVSHRSKSTVTHRQASFLDGAGRRSGSPGFAHVPNARHDLWWKHPEGVVGDRALVGNGRLLRCHKGQRNNFALGGLRLDQILAQVCKTLAHLCVQIASHHGAGHGCSAANFAGRAPLAANHARSLPSVLATSRPGKACTLRRANGGHGASVVVFWRDDVEGGDNRDLRVERLLCKVQLF